MGLCLHRGCGGPEGRRGGPPPTHALTTSPCPPFKRKIPLISIFRMLAEFDPQEFSGAWFFLFRGDCPYCPGPRCRPLSCLSALQAPPSCVLYPTLPLFPRHTRFSNAVHFSVSPLRTRYALFFPPWIHHWWHHRRNRPDADPARGVLNPQISGTSSAVPLPTRL